MGIGFNFNLDFNKSLNTEKSSYSYKTDSITGNMNLTSQSSQYKESKNYNSNNVETETLDLDTKEVVKSNSNNTNKSSLVDFSDNVKSSNSFTTENTNNKNSIDSNVNVTDTTSTNSNSNIVSSNNQNISSSSTNNKDSMKEQINIESTQSKKGDLNTTSINSNTSTSNNSNSAASNTSRSSQGNIEISGSMASPNSSTQSSLSNDNPDSSNVKEKENISINVINTSSSVIDTSNNSSEILNLEQVNLSIEDYLNESDKLYLEELDQNIANYEEMIEMLQKQITDYEQISVNGYYFSQLYDNYQDALLSIDSYWVNDVATQYQTYCSEEKAKELGVNSEDLMYMSLPEIFEIIKEKDSDYKKQIENANEQKMMLDAEVKKATGFANYEEYANTLDAWRNDLATFSAALYQSKQLRKTAKYTLLTEAVADKEIEPLKLEIDIANKSLIFNEQTYVVDYNTYKSNGGQLNPIEFLKQVKEALPDYEVQVEDKELLESLIGYSKTLESAGKVYEYLYQENPDLARQYLIDMKADLNAYAGSTQAQQFLNSLSKNENGEYDYADILNHLKVTGKGLGDGVEQFGEGMLNFGDLVLSLVGLGSKEDPVYSVNEYETMYILQALQSGKIKTNDDNSNDEKLNSNPFNLLDNNYEISQSIGNMAPSMAIGIIFSPIAGTALMGASAGGGSYHQALVEGKDKGNAIAYGILSGLSEAVLERYLGKIPGLSKIMDDGVKMTFTEFVKRMASEGIEEGTQEWIDSFLKMGFFDEEFSVTETAKNSLKSGIYGAITAMIMNGGTTAVNYAVATSQMNKISSNLASMNINELLAYKVALDEAIKNQNLDEYIKNKENGGEINSQFEEMLFTQELIEMLLKNKANHENFDESMIEQQDNGEKLIEIEHELDEDIKNYSDTDTDFTISQVMDAGQYKKACIMLLSLAKDQKTKNLLKEILYTGKVDDFTFVTDMNSKNNPNIEGTRRLSMASLLLTNPETFNYLKENNINIFHGTSGDILPSILEYGLSNVNDLRNNNIDVTTGESWSRISGNRDFLSFTDVLDTAKYYASIHGDYGFKMVIGTSKENLKNNRVVAVHSDVSEIGISGIVSKENIDCILVPSDKVETVKKMVNDDSIKVLPIDYDSKIYWDNEGIEVFESKYNELKEKLQMQSVQTDDRVLPSLERAVTAKASLSEMSSDIETIIEFHDSRYGTGSTIEQLKRFLDPNDEYYQDYNVITSFGNARTLLKKYDFNQIKSMVEEYEKTQDLKTIIKFHDERYGAGSTIAQLKKFLDSNNKYYQNYNVITSFGNARALLKKYNFNEIKSMVKEYEYQRTQDLKTIIEFHDKKYGIGDTIAQLKKFLDPTHEYYQDYNVITSFGNARTLLKKYDFNEIKSMVEEYEMSQKSQIIEFKDDGKKNESTGNVTLNNKTGSNKELYNFFESFGKILGHYGVDQAYIEKMCDYIYNGVKYSYKQARDKINAMKKNKEVLLKWKQEINTKEYFELQAKIMDRGFSEEEAEIILTIIDDPGACTYSDTCNEIFYLFRNNPELFENLFGYKMYKERHEGLTLNSGDLLLDLYLFANDTENGGAFINNNSLQNYSDTKVDVLGRKILDTDQQAYMSNWNSKNVSVIDAFLKSKSPNLHYESYTILNRYGNSHIENRSDAKQFVNALLDELNNGRILTLDYAYFVSENDKPIRMICIDNQAESMSTDSWVEEGKDGGAHSVTITGVVSEGLYVSSWAHKFFIPMEDLIGSKFSIFSSKVEYIEEAKGNVR